MDKQLEKLFQDQIKNEWYSAYLYLSMAAWFESAEPRRVRPLDVQAGRRGAGPREEDVRLPHRPRSEGRPAGHPPASGGFRLARRGIREELRARAEGHRAINGIADQADKVNDHPTKVFIQWFITEQVEEEKNASRILDLLKKIPPNSAGIFQLDHQLRQAGIGARHAAFHETPAWAGASSPPLP